MNFQIIRVLIGGCSYRQKPRQCFDKAPRWESLIRPNTFHFIRHRDGGSPNNGPEGSWRSTVTQAVNFHHDMRRGGNAQSIYAIY